MRGYRTNRLSGERVLYRTSGPRSDDGAWVHAACNPKRVAIETAIGHLAAFSPKLIPGKTVYWEPPSELSRLETILADTGEILGDEIVIDVVVLPADPRRRRFGLLMSGQRSRTQIAFAKFSANPLNRYTEAALTLLGKANLAWWIPRVITTGTDGEWSYEITTPLPSQPHRPARFSHAALHQLAQEMHSSLLPISRDFDEPLSHGDFGPWNVRKLRNGPVAVIDWEDLRPAPRPTDELWWLSSSSLLHNERESVAASRIGAYLTRYYSARESIAAIDTLAAHVVRPQPAEVGGAPPGGEVLADQQRYVATLRAVRESVDRLR